VRKGGFEPPRSCERQPLKLERVNAERSRPRKTEVGCAASLPIEVIQRRRRPFGLQILANEIQARAAFSSDARTAAGTSMATNRSAENR